MKDFIIGQPVACSGYTAMEYDDKNNRQAVDYPCQPFNGVVVGRKIQPLGKYHSASYGYEGEGEPAYLSISSTIEFWEVKTGWRNKPLLVRDEHVGFCAAFKVPMQTRRPTVLQEPATAAA